MDCLFCKIIKKEISSNIIYEDENFLAFLDLDQTVLGHTLIVPKKHFNDYAELDKDTLFNLMKVAELVSKKLMKKLNKKGISLTFNYGSLQEIKHVHLHLLPETKDDSQKTIEEIYNIIKSD